MSGQSRDPARSAQCASLPDWQLLTIVPLVAQASLCPRGVERATRGGCWRPGSWVPWVRHIDIYFLERDLCYFLCNLFSHLGIQHDIVLGQ